MSTPSFRSVNVRPAHVRVLVPGLALVLALSVSPLMAQGRGGGGGGGKREGGPGRGGPPGQNQPAERGNQADNRQANGNLAAANNGPTATGLSAQFSAQMIQQFDTDGDQALNQTELQACLELLYNQAQAQIAQSRQAAEQMVQQARMGNAGQQAAFSGAMSGNCMAGNGTTTDITGNTSTGTTGNFRGQMPGQFQMLMSSGGGQQMQRSSSFGGRASGGGASGRSLRTGGGRQNP